LLFHFFLLQILITIPLCFLSIHLTCTIYSHQHTMDPSQCTLVILTPNQYTNNLHYPYLDTLQTVFDQVLITDKENSSRIFQQKHHYNTLFFMDLDMIQDQDDHTSLDSSSGSSTSTMDDDRLTWIKGMTRHFIHHPVIGKK
ncbi:hypothetical protein BC941DRAFT_412603, partial [Chlamydoabsidia padenii]